MAEFARGPQVSYDVWLSDKKEPKEKEFKTGTKAFEFFASRATDAYTQWRSADKENSTLATSTVAPKSSFISMLTVAILSFGI